MDDSSTLEKLAFIQQKIEKLTEAFEGVSKQMKRPTRRLTTESIFDDDDIFPISTISEMNDFEAKLKSDREFRRKLTKSLSSNIGGTSGEVDFKKVGDYLLSYCFTPELLKEHSYTGMSKNKYVSPKPAFKKYTSITKLIFVVLKSADSSFTMIANEEYLQKKFKNAQSKFGKRVFEDEFDE
ncbi:uncharacterized protein LOC129571134 [Sitodiplosis mosellana]|uniref:uncharacterized protein LOC129571134 n=1 Tax=Sitodiplosis mosellana TaxID=263140 RepID=UPI002443D220|nr:uncharacterized protein LOC129571134 [Sitodiplosis mosellana]XP_055306874.1 uncharacterized protein LOC129571134 [Sitodiplosis mosellana]